MALTSTIKLAAMAIVCGIGIFTSVWAIDDRYVDEREIVASLKDYNREVNIRIEKLQRQNLQTQYNDITDRYYRLQSLIAQHGPVPALVAELDWVEKRREELRKQLRN